MSIEAADAGWGVIGTRNGVPPAASDPPGGIPRTPDPDVQPHAVPTPAEPELLPDLPVNEPPMMPPRREAQHRTKHK